MFRFFTLSQRFAIPCSNGNSERLFKLYTTSLRKANKSSGTQESFTVQYLMSQCGFSKERAVLASSKYLNFDKPDQPDSVITFLKNHGFTHSQIRKVVASYSHILCSKPRKTLLPKIKFLRSKGFSETDVARILVSVPRYFKRSLQKCIVPSFSFIKDFIGSEKDASLAISGCARILLEVERHVKPNIDILLGAGMSQSAVAGLLKTQPFMFVSSKDKLKESVKQVQNMKLDPESCDYGLALSTKARKLMSLRNANQDSFTVKYLVNQCGFSMEKAVLCSSKYAIFDNPDQPDSVISFFKSQGFTETQIRKLVAAEPRILSYKPQKTFLPKIQFLRSNGFLAPDLVKLLSLIPAFFRRSLENCIVPSFSFIKDFLGSEKDAIFAISDCPRTLLEVESLVKPNIEILLGAGMSKSAIARLLKLRPSIFVIGQDKFKESVKQVQNMKLDPESCGYGLALWILAVTRRHSSTWDKRMEAYKRWGCSEKDVLRSSKNCPTIMKISEEKLNGIMSLFVHEIGWEPSEVVKRYFMFRLSLKERMIPRWLVYQELLSKGLVNNLNIGTLFRMKEDRFLNMFGNRSKDETPFTVRYLMNQFGFSMERAVLYSSKYIKFDKPDKPDSVISFFKKHGFTDSQIQKLVTSYPPILCSIPHKTLMPKIEFFRSKGCPEKDLARIISFIPKSLHRNLENYIEPSFHFFKEFLGSEKDAFFAISLCPRVLLELESHVKPSIEILRGVGMSQSAIARLMKSRPSIFVSGLGKLKESIKQVQDMKMDPESCGYGVALWTLTVTRSSCSDQHERIEAYKRWGCSEDDVLMGSKICPTMLTISKERLNGIMSLFVNEIGWEASEVVRRYFMFTLSLNRRLIPRWSVYQELLSKGLVKKKVSLSTLFTMKEDRFLQTFLNLYKDEAPWLLKLYTEKQGLK